MAKGGTNSAKNRGQDSKQKPSVANSAATADPAAPAVSSAPAGDQNATPTPTPAQNATEGGTVTLLRIASKVEGFRRAGRAWSTTAVDVPASDFTEAQVNQLKAEPNLVVVEIEVAEKE